MLAGMSRSIDRTVDARPAFPPIVMLLAFAKLGIELAYAGAYGYSRDELYFLACARRLGWGYVDRPPLAVAVLAAARFVGGESLLAIRVVPAAVGALVIGLTAVLAKTFGGSVRAQGLAALCVLVAPEYMASSHVYSSHGLDILFWTFAVLFAARALSADPGRERLSWILLGGALGLGLENQLGIAAFGAGLVLGIATTPSRAWQKTPWPWVAAMLAIVLASPYALWEKTHGWPTPEWFRDATEKIPSISAGELFREVAYSMMPLSAPLGLLGLGALVLGRRFVTWRALGVALVFVFLLLMLRGKARAGDFSPAYPPLFAAGAVFAEEWLEARSWAFPACAALVLLAGLALLPFSVPVLPASSYLGYAKRLGQESQPEEKRELGPLPQRYADMFGWKEMTRNVAVVYESLTEEDRRDAAILASNSGEAGAIETFGPEMGLPTPISGHDSYWFWGHAGASGRVVLTVGGAPDLWRARCENVEVAAVFANSRVMPSEDHLRICICRRTKVPLEALWAELRHYG
jgi:hypothetical protein